jgi:two-component system CheB/CheR fusion protein
MFYVVGMGGSAGGLEAFEKFFSNIPPDSGAAFILVSHFDPSKKGMMPEILQRFTKMPVMQAEDGMKVRPDNVYVIPSNKNLSISDGVLKLSELPSGLKMPIDFFFRSLAKDIGERCVGIIFSGMGTDGTLGVKAIHEKMGLVMAQDPGTTEFYSMPQSAISTGVVDYVAPPEDMPNRLIEYLGASMELQKKVGIKTAKGPSALDDIIALIRERTGRDFSFYKQNTICRRIEKRMSLLQLKDVYGYVDFLKNNPSEIDDLFKELLIGVTSFFRDPEAFETLKDRATPLMLEHKPANSVIRVWVPGCSTGEEAYSIAIVLAESVGLKKDKIQIFATDIDRESISVARNGVYPRNIESDVSNERLQRFFINEEGGYRVKKEIREMIVFAEQDVISDPAFTNLDMISCRNLLIYMNPDAQKHVFATFAYCMNAWGILFLGSSESIAVYGDLFSTVDRKWKIFERNEYMPKGIIMDEMPIRTPIPGAGTNIQEMKIGQNITELAHQAIMENIVPPSVFIDRKGNIIYINGRVGKYLEPAPGRAQMNIYLMARKEISTQLSMGIEKALREKREVVLTGLEVKVNGHKQAVNVTIKPIGYPEALKGCLFVAFQDVEEKSAATETEPKKRSSVGECNDLKEELDFTRQKLQNVLEEMHASQEEQRSINEELQSANEELHSTNEELMTSKEELQSLNEELVTVNSELHAKIDDLTHLNNDMTNLFNGTEIAVIFLDNNLNIKRFTPTATKIVNLIPSDIGRPITDISTEIKDERMAEDAQKVIKTLTPIDKQLKTSGGLWYQLHIIPYRTVDNVIDGAVLTFNDITSIKKLEASLGIAKDYAENIIATVREPLIILDGHMDVVSANQSFYRDFKVAPGETVGKQFFDLGNGQWNITSLREKLEKVLPEEKSFADYRVEHDFPRIGRKVVMLNARIIQSENANLILLAIDDVTNKICA